MKVRQVAAAFVLPVLLGAALFIVYREAARFSPPALRILFNSIAPTSYYDPARAQVSQDYLFLENTTSTLLEYSGGDKLVSGLAATFEWEGAEARFGMRPGVRTVDGRPIDAYDAELSLKRAFILGGRDYDLLRGLLCGVAPLKKLSDPCPGLRVLDSGRTLAMKFEEKKTFLFHFLTNITYAVLPRGSVDPATLVITDHRNTSGPYYVSSDQGGGFWEIKANPLHYRYSPDMPQAVKPLPLRGIVTNQQCLDMLSDGKVDYMISGLARNPDEKVRFVAANPGYNINLTQPVRLVYAVFTDKGMKALTRKERFFIGAKMRALYLAGREMCEAPDQIFRLEGALSREQLAEVSGLLNPAGEMVIRKKITGGGLDVYLSRPGDKLNRWLPGIVRSEWVSGAKRPVEDFFMGSGDIGFQDDAGLVTNYLRLNFFSMSPAQKNDWFARYLAAPDKKARAGLLRDLHYSTLAEGRVIPIALMQYSSVARKPWQFNFPAMCGGDQLWRLRSK